MTESGYFLPEEVQDIITPSSESARTIRDYVEILIDDDPSLNLENTESAELEGLSMRFIGWQHTFENVPALFTQIKAYDPQVLILESFGGSAQGTRNKELIENLLMFGVHTQIGINGEYTEAVIREDADHEHELLMKLIRDSEVFPIWRKMDATDEQIAELNLFDQFFTHNLFYDSEWSRKPLAEIEQEFQAVIMADALQGRARESIMIKDVSRIVANALAKLNGEEIRVMVCFGAGHTPIARHFQKRGINADLRFIDGQTEELKTSQEFTPYQSLLREGNVRGGLSRRNTKRFLLSSLFELNLPVARKSLGDQRSHTETRTEDKEIAARLVKSHGEEIWGKWARSTSRYLLTRGMKEKAAEKFEGHLGLLLMKALEETGAVVELA